MEEFSIYCTEELTKRALKLGAPIDNTGTPDDMSSITFCHEYDNGDWVIVFRPTAEQMKNWLKRVHKIYIHIYEWDFWEYDMSYNGQYYEGMFYKTEEEALFAAFNVALDILEEVEINNTKND